MDSSQSQLKSKKKRTSPLKESESPVVASLPKDIIASCFIQDLPHEPLSTVGQAKDGISTDIRATPVVNIAQVRTTSYRHGSMVVSLLRKVGHQWQGLSPEVPGVRMAARQDVEAGM